MALLWKYNVVSFRIVNKDMQNTQQHIFEDKACDWWNEEGTFKLLHTMTPFRLMFILKHVKNHFNITTLQNLSILDVGCGGGLLCEPLTRLGACVTGIDQSTAAIAIAKDHAEKQALTIDYRRQDLEEMPSHHFDVVIASEVIEHVDDQRQFMNELSRVVKKGGCVILTTLNRTFKSYVLGILAAEYVLAFAPPGTHDHKAFVKPSEMRALMNNAGLSMISLQGLSFNPLSWSFQWSDDLSINYFSFATCSKE